MIELGHEFLEMLASFLETGELIEGSASRREEHDIARFGPFAQTLEGLIERIALFKDEPFG